MLLFGEICRAWQYCPILKRHVLDILFFEKQLYWTHEKDVRLLLLTCWMDEEAHHIGNESPFEEEALFHQ